jgi:hypothetical protein
LLVGVAILARYVFAGWGAKAYLKVALRSEQVLVGLLSTGTVKSNGVGCADRAVAIVPGQIEEEIEKPSCKC